ncbi:MAG: iron-binding protein [Deltaproteobacteria bacterium CG11_big_fil_rev_8_21_14_0_20_47_16]|nr:MAG: iron-binding protein [Deltaproteobacteria bacterium CG11_big_fil_rev_8_21_14_0_20_47_16]
MSRLVKHDAKAPLEVKPSEKSVWVCMCGLSANYPFCDGTHKQCRNEEEGKLYKYVDGARVEIKD